MVDGVARRRAAGDLVFLAAAVIAIILILHIIFVLLDANPNNDIVRTDADWAGWLATWFKDLFTPSNPKLNVFLNYGLATLVYLAIGGILRRVLNDALA
ncbi:MAG: hypothetical protein JF587_17415 [Catenulisporales bacterium]|jgi:hypothetical protein|nr:hypothetical protein [Catenulisporales bacterium]